MARIALLCCLVFIVYLFRLDGKKAYVPSAALWIPLTWMFLAGSRWASSWFNLSVPMASANDYSEGSPVDRTVFFSLILVGAYILSKRKIDWNRLFNENKILAVYFLYCLLSIFWTDDSFVLFKRWVKDLGNPIMALVILTERRPYLSAGVILRRLSYLLIPLSVLFVRYFPEMGRTYHADGSPMYTGVGHQKNDLGGMCLLAGMYYAWEFIQNRRQNLETDSRTLICYYLLILMVAWLLRMSNSQTSLFSLIVATLIFMVGRVGFIARKPQRIVLTIVLTGLILSVLETSFHIKDFIFQLLGRDPSLTNRTELWKVVTSLEVNALIGAGFMSFWTGDRMDIVAMKMGTLVNQAHSGYIEQYINLGYIGVGFIFLILSSSLVNVYKHIAVDVSAGMFRFIVIMVSIFLNYTEACFYGINNFWLLLLLVVIDVSGQPSQESAVSSEIRAEKERVSSPRYHRYKKHLTDKDC